MVSKFKRYLIAAGIGFGLILGFCGKHQVKVEEQHMAPTLGEKDSEKYTIKSSGGTFKVTRISRKAGHDGAKAATDVAVVSDLGEARNATLTVEKDGSVKVWVQTKGLCFRPGIGALFYGRPRLALDAEWAFYRRHRLMGGVSFLPTGFSPRIYAAYGYNFYGNTSAFVGVDSSKQILFGVRVGL